MAQERLSNYDNFQQLWDFYTGEGGMSNTQAAGMLGNIYAESRGNPAAINPNDGSDGSDSGGIIQWNGGRANALRRFAAHRGTTADDLLTQARFSMIEGSGPEQRGFRQGLEGATAGDSALGFARGYIRPASQHIPQRAAYGDMMYDIFANGNPNGVTAGLAYGPEQAERMSREPASRFSFGEGMPAMDERTGAPVGADRNEIAANFSRMFIEQAGQGPDAMTAGPMPPMVGPRQDMADALGDNSLADLQAQAEDRMVTTTAPQLGEVGGASGELPDYQDYDAIIDEQFPAAEGEPSTSEELSAVMWPIAEASAYSLGVPVEDAPTTPQGVVEAANAPEPDPEDNSEDAERRRNRRLLAADMLQTLSVGLGQMSVGQAVNLGDVLNNQQTRGMARDEMAREAEAAQLAQQQQQQQAFTVAQEFSAMGMDGMARIAMSGPDGLGQALDTLGQIQGRAPATNTGFADLNVADRQAALRYAGLDEQDVTFFAQDGMEDLAIDMIRAGTMPDPTADAAAADQAGVEREIRGLAGIGSDYANDPAVRTAFTSADKNPTQANATALREALAAAGASEAELAASASEAPVPLTEGEVAFYRNTATPEQLEFAMEDAGAAEQIRNAGGEALEKGAIAQAQQDVMQNVPPERIRFLEDLAANPVALRTEMQLRYAEAGVGLNLTQETMLKQVTDGMGVTHEQLRTRAPMITAMEMLIGELSADGYDRTAGGPADRLLGTIQNLAAQAGLEVDFQSDPANFLQRLVDAQQGEFFQNFRLAGSGATSDKEAENFMNAMPRVGDSAIKQLGMAQRIVRQYEMQERAAELENQWMLETADDPNLQLNQQARSEYVQDGVAAMERNIFPTMDMTAENGREQLIKDRASGNITNETVVRYVSQDGEVSYLMYKDIVDSLGE
tara:strand:- start:384 stop:3101 length:2718 start_codon:yes stop_codon:yes gene_type:complete